MPASTNAFDHTTSTPEPLSSACDRRPSAVPTAWCDLPDRPDPDSDRYPHIHGPMPVGAVVDVIRVVHDAASRTVPE